MRGRQRDLLAVVIGLLGIIASVVCGWLLVTQGKILEVGLVAGVALVAAALRLAFYEPDELPPPS